MQALDPTEVVNWVNLAANGVRVLVEGATGPAPSLVIRAKRPLTASERANLARLGFAPTAADGSLARRGNKFTLREIRSVFPEAFAITVERHWTWDVAAPAAVRAAEQADARAEGRLNAYQNKYRPASKVGKPMTAIPVNLAGATRRALERLEAERGSIDDYVASALHWSVDRVAQALSPEQVDAVGLALFSAEEGRDFVLADMTGIGKGRTLAAIARAMALRGLPVVFVTEKANLFSDFFRDIEDIGSAEAFGTPFLLNDKAQISRDGPAGTEVVYPARPSRDIQEAIKRFPLGAGKGYAEAALQTFGQRAPFVMTSYSQLNRPGSPKTAFLEAVAKGAHVLLDESHNAVGDSNTSLAIGNVIEDAEAVTNSSATFARHAKNLAAYKRLFPPSMRTTDLSSVLETGGRAMSEALATMLAESGSYLRREHDLSDISIRVVADEARLDRNRLHADAISPVLAGIAQLARGVNDVVNERNGGKDEPPRKGKELWSAGNFGSRLSAVMRQFVTCLKVDLCVDRAVEALGNDVKPVVVIESTMESLMRELSEEGAREDEVEEEAPDASVEAEAEASAQADRRPPSFRDALQLFLDRTLTITLRKPGSQDPEKVVLDDPFLVAQATEIRRLIAAMPDLTMSPIDEIKARIEARGRALGKAWRADEISARSLSVVDGRYVPLPARERNAIVSDFQSGASDALVITRAASTGLSLHASEKARDQRRRCMIELQIASNVVERMQFMGRVNRRGQVSEPYFETLSTGLPLENRQLAMQNRKLQDMSANVTGASQNASEMDVPDLINAEGNLVCRRFLEARPTLADRMHVAMKLPDPEKAAGELYHVNKLLQRLCLLPSKEQDAVYATVLEAYEADVRDIKAKGGTIGGARELPGQWTVVERETFERGDPRDGPVFGRPVTLTTIERIELLQPIRAERVRELVEEGSARIPEASGEPFGSELKAIRLATPLVLQRSLPRRFISVQQAQKDLAPNAVKEAESRIARLVALLRTARPGSPITVKTEEGAEGGFVVDVTPPEDPKEIANPSQWRLSYVLPGGESVRHISAAAVNDDPETHVGRSALPLPAGILARFDKAPSGAVRVRRRILDGNIVRATLIARHQGWGIVTWHDAEGMPGRAVLIPKSRQNALATLPGRTTSARTALAVLDAGGSIWTNRDERDDGAEITATGRTLRIALPTRKAAAKPFEAASFLQAAGPIRTQGKDRYIEAPLGRAGDVLHAMAEAGHAFNFEGRFRAVAANLPDEAEEAEEPDEAPRPRA